MRASLMPCAISAHVVPAAERVRNRGSPIVPRSNIEIMGWLRKIECRTDAGSASHKLVCGRTRLRAVGERWRTIACSTEPGIHRRRLCGDDRALLPASRLYLGKRVVTRVDPPNRAWAVIQVVLDCHIADVGAVIDIDIARKPFRRAACWNDAEIVRQHDSGRIDGAWRRTEGIARWRCAAENTAAIDCIVVDGKRAAGNTDGVDATAAQHLIIVALRDVVAKDITAARIIDQDCRSTIVVAVVVLVDRIGHAFIEIVRRPITSHYSGGRQLLHAIDLVELDDDVVGLPRPDPDRARATSIIPAKIVNDIE